MLSRIKRPSMNDAIAKYGVFGAGWEQLSEDLYDYQAYAAAGQQVLSFFQQPIGAAGKTVEDTNMQLAGQLAQGQMFLVNGIVVDFQGGNVASSTGAIVAANANDFKLVGDRGALIFSIGSKPYYTGAPLKRFPMRQYVGGDFAIADTTTAGAAQRTKIELPRFCGHPCAINPVMIPSLEAFNVSLSWTTSIAVSVAGRIGVRLLGTKFRKTQ